MTNEGDVSTGTGSVTLSWANNEDLLYYCVNLGTSLMKETVLYPSIVAACVTCEEDDEENELFCDIDFLLEEYHQFFTFQNATFQTDDEKINKLKIKFDLETDFVFFDFFDNLDQYDRTYFGNPDATEGRRKFTKYFDELVDWAVHVEDYPIVSINGMYLGSGLLVYSSISKESFVGLPYMLYAETFNAGWGLACSSIRCYLGILYGTTFKAVKDYEGLFTNFAVAVFDQNDDADSYDGENLELVCLQLSNTANTGGSERDQWAINDCGTRAYWQSYYAVVSQYPIWFGEIFYDTWLPTDIDKDDEN
jgi:hypothetical protein